MTKMPSIAPDLAEGIPAIPVEQEEEVKVKH